MLMGGGVDSPAPPMLPLRSTRTVHIPPTRSLVFPADRNPLLPPPARKTDLPFSSQDRFSSPEKDNYVSAQNSHERDQAEQEKEMPARAGPSRPRQPPLPRPVLVSMSDEEDDFDGIEDVLPTQEDPIDRPRPTPRGEAFGKAKLADLFADDEDRAESPSYQARPKLRPDSAQADSLRRPKSSSSSRSPLVDLSSSPPLFPSAPVASSSQPLKHSHSNTPPSPMLRTPHVDDVDADEIDEADGEIEWTPSPVTQRTRTHRVDRKVSSPPPASPTVASRQYAPSTSISKSKSKINQAIDLDAGIDEDPYDDLPFPDDFDFDSLEEPSGSGETISQPHRDREADPGRAFRPPLLPTTTIATDYTSPYSSRPSRIVAALDEMDDPNRLLLIPDLTPAEQDFYRNHWRRGADNGSKKRTAPGDEEEECSDGGFSGPQPPAKKKTYKRAGGGFKRGGGFRGRGRGRGRARGGKR